MDLRMCGKLSQNLINKELEWLKVIDLYRVWRDTPTIFF